MGDHDAVTGAFGFTGRAIAERLLVDGRSVVTLTRRSGADDPLTRRLRVEPFDADRPDALVRALDGVDTLYVTYWIRFPRNGMTYERAVARSAALFAAARSAGVRRIVHVSVVNATFDARTPYVRAKAALEAVLATAGVDWSIVRPTLTTGPGDILINDLAWALRRLPVFGIPGAGRYTVRPVHVDDVARICIEAAGAPAGTIVDAAGPEILAYRDLVRLVRTAVGSRSVVVPMPAPVVLAASRVLGRIVDDVVFTSDEIDELTSSLLASHAPPLGRIRISEWISRDGPTLGIHWSSELARNYRFGGGSSRERVR